MTCAGLKSFGTFCQRSVRNTMALDLIGEAPRLVGEIQMLRPAAIIMSGQFGLLGATSKSMKKMTPVLLQNLVFKRQRIDVH